LIRVEGEEENMISEVVIKEKEKDFFAATKLIESKAHSYKRKSSVVN